MTAGIFPLTSEQLQTYIQYFLDIDANIAGEPWTVHNFKYDLPGKWDFSFFSVSDNGEISGVLIASRKIASIHIHRLAVAKHFQNRGIGKHLIEAIIRKTIAEKLNRVTLKVSKKNVSVILFYKKLGFRVYADELDNHCMEIKLPH